MRFSIRSLLLLTFFIAWVVAWPSSGAMIGPAMLVCSFAVALVTAFVSHPRVKIAFRSSLLVFAAVVCLYLSIGPASWFLARLAFPPPNAPNMVHSAAYSAYRYLYEPIASNAILSPEPLRQLSFSYIRWWMPNTVQFEEMGGEDIGWSDGTNWYTLISYRYG